MKTFISALLTLMIIVLIQKISVCFMKSKAVYTPDEVLKRKKPFYINKTAWDKIREKALIHKIGQDKFCSFINMIKPYYFTDTKIDYISDGQRKSSVHKTLEH